MVPRYQPNFILACSGGEKPSGNFWINSRISELELATREVPYPAIWVRRRPPYVCTTPYRITTIAESAWARDHGSVIALNKVPYFTASVVLFTGSIYVDKDLGIHPFVLSALYWEILLPCGPMLETPPDGHTIPITQSPDLLGFYLAAGWDAYNRLEFC